MKASDLKDMNQGELEQELNELKEELFRLRFQHATNQLANTSQLKHVKRDIARVKTVMRQQSINDGGIKA